MCDILKQPAFLVTCEKYRAWPLSMTYWVLWHWCSSVPHRPSGVTGTTPAGVTEATGVPEFPSFTCQFLSAVQTLGDLVWLGVFWKIKELWRLSGFTREVTNSALLLSTGQLGLPSTGRHQQKHGGSLPAHIWWCPASDLYPHAQRLLSPLHELHSLQGFAEVLSWESSGGIGGFKYIYY